MAAVVVCFAWGTIAAAQNPDTILIHGKILTVDAKDSVVEALSIANGKIVAVGSSAEIQRQAGPATRVIDLHGLTATPGLIDTHGHFAASGVDELYSVVLNDVHGVSDAVSAPPACAPIFINPDAEPAQSPAISAVTDQYELCER